MKRGSKINYQNKNGWSPLHHAIEGRLPSKIINWLIEHGADLHLEDNEGLDCCDKVARDNSYPKIKVLRDYQCKLNR